MASDLQQLSEQVQKFCEDREWDQFHNVKDLAIGLVTESSELLELFRFQTPEQVVAIMNDAQSRTLVEDELADILFFLLRFAQMNRVDLSQSLLNKIEKNAKKYPIETARASNAKYSKQK